MAARDHLFVSYAQENWALAEWLTLRLTAENYRVWCRSFQVLGGERYPQDIDDAIRNSTFRVIALLSRASMSDPHAIKERMLALHLARERNIDFLLLLNVDGLRFTECDWMTSDVTFLPFHEHWTTGFSQLLKKLRVIDTPRTLVNGRQIATEAREAMKAKRSWHTVL